MRGGAGRLGGGGFRIAPVFCFRLTPGHVARWGRRVSRPRTLSPLSPSPLPLALCPCPSSFPCCLLVLWIAPAPSLSPLAPRPLPGSKARFPAISPSQATLGPWTKSLSLSLPLHPACERLVRPFPCNSFFLGPFLYPSPSSILTLSYPLPFVLSPASLPLPLLPSPFPCLPLPFSASLPLPTPLCPFTYPPSSLYVRPSARNHGRGRQGRAHTHRGRCTSVASPSRLIRASPPLPPGLIPHVFPFPSRS